MTPEAAAIESAPAKPRRRWLRFSLRTLLVAVALFGIWLGIRCRNASRQKAAVAAIRAAGGKIAYLYGNEAHPSYVEDPPPPRGVGWLRNLTGIDFFETVVYVHLDRADGRVLAALEDLPDVRAISIQEVKVPDDVMAHIGRLPLQQLLISDCEITPSGWRALEGLDCLSELELFGPNVSDDTLSHITAVNTLKHLTLWETDVTDEGLESLQRIESLKDISLNADPAMTADGVSELRQLLPSARIKVIILGLRNRPPASSRPANKK